MKKFVRIRTRNSTARPLRRSILVDDWAVVRLGSLTPNDVIKEESGIPWGARLIEINTPDSIENSRSKLRMKDCFATKKVPQADWWVPMTYNNGRNMDIVPEGNDYDNRPTPINRLPYPILAKRVFGFQGRGMKLLQNETELIAWLREHSNLGGWFFEVYHNYAREYRLHVGRKVGVFLSWRKLRRRDATERWFFNSENCEWYGEQHAMFDTPKCWKAMCKAAVDALTSTGLDIGAVDIRVQSNTQDDPKFIVCEINSAPALGEVGVEKYKEVIKTIIDYKKNGRSNM
jgi:glutathione synthase/RimK-type ligase-like ATP-grasp enzyme